MAGKRKRGFSPPLLQESDIVITGALVPGERAPVLITREMVAGMEKGSIICDVAVDQGGIAASQNTENRYGNMASS